MRIGRGSNLKGYSGVQLETQKEGYKIIKPLIFTTKEEIEEYNKDNNIKYFVDKTNDEDKYTRNRYRHNVLPFLKEETKNVHLKYLKFSKELIKYYDFVDNVVKEEISKRYNKKTLYLDGFKDLSDLLKIKIIEYILDDNYEKNLYLVSDKHVKIILDIIDNPKPNIEINLPDHLRITKSYNKLYVTRKENQKKDYYILLEDETLLPNGKTIKIVKEHDDTSNYVTRLNTKELSLPLYVRNRKKGDKITIKNMKSAKKVKDIYIDSKLTIEQRDIQPIVVDSQGELIWIPGLKKTKFDKSKRENYDIILWYN
jgi:tRNA(Ile)-lysidine synthase